MISFLVESPIYLLIMGIEHLHGEEVIHSWLLALPPAQSSNDDFLCATSGEVSCAASKRIIQLFLIIYNFLQ